MATAYFRGLAYPFKQDSVALPAPVTDDELVKQSILQILTTSRGERIMRPQFGCNLERFVFDNNAELMGQMLRAEIVASVGQFEPRANIVDISLEPQESSLVVTVVYEVVATKTLNSVQVAVNTVAT